MSKTPLKASQREHDEAYVWNKCGSYPYTWVPHRVLHSRSLRLRTEIWMSGRTPRFEGCFQDAFHQQSRGFSLGTMAVFSDLEIVQGKRELDYPQPDTKLCHCWYIADTSSEIKGIFYGGCPPIFESYLYVFSCPLDSIEVWCLSHKSYHRKWTWLAVLVLHFSV